MKRFLSLMLAFALVFSLMPLAHAQQSRDTGNGKLFQSELEAIDYVRSMLVQRVTDFTVQLPMRLYYTNVLEKILDEAMRFSENPKEGDSLRWQSFPENCYSDVKAGYAYLHYSMSYLTTAQEEAELDAAMDALLAELGCDTSDDYGTVKTVYDWVCANVSYDKGTPYADSAYGALIQRKASGYGFALLLHQLYRKLGIASRVIPGTVSGQDHAWNIVGFDGPFYCVDAALDAGKTEYTGFLMGKEAFSDHYAYSEEVFSGISVSNVNYEDRWDPCEHMGHNWAGGTCVETKICTRCGVRSQEYGLHYFPNNGGCETARFCDTCKELILPTAHAYDDDQDRYCDACGHYRIIICLGEPWRIDASFIPSAEGPKVTVDPGVTVTLVEKGKDFFTYDLTFPGIGRYQVQTERGGEYQPEQFDVHVIDHRQNAAFGDCACFADAHTHTWVEATCQAPRTCSECGVTEGEKWDHIFYTPDCIREPGVCYMCGLTQDSPPGHDYVFDSDIQCRRCNQQRITACTEGAVEYWLNSDTADGFTLTHCDPGLTVTEGEYRLSGNIHCWQRLMTSTQVGQYEVVFTDKATGEKKGVTVRIEPHAFVEGRCYLCMQTDPSVHFHTWIEATCTEPRTCSECGITEGYSRGHNLMNGPCTEARGCANCDLVMEAPSHYYSDDNDPDCNFCGQERYVVCGDRGISVILSSGEGGDFKLQNAAEGFSMALLEYFVAEAVHYWEYVIYTPGPGVYDVSLIQEDGEEPLGVSLYVYDHEFVEGICWICGTEEGKHVHNWQSATCQEAAVCTECGQTEAGPLNHDFGGYFCSEYAECRRCGEKRGKVAHSYDDMRDRYCNLCNRYRVAGCQEDTFVIIVSNEYLDGFRLKEAPSGVSIEYRGCYSNWGVYEHTYAINTPGTGTFELVLEDLITDETFEVTIQRFKHDFEYGECVNCGKLDGTAHRHEWINATCQEPKTCRLCGQTDGKPREHSWWGPTCTEGKTCMDCNATTGEPLGHDFYEWSCVEPGVCTRCNALQETVSGHSYDGDTDDRCNRCDQFRLIGCPEQVLEISFSCDTEIPFTLVNPANGVSLTLATCVQEGDQFIHTYRISVPGKGTYELTAVREGMPDRQNFTVLVVDHSYENGVCGFCGGEMTGLMGDVDGNGKLTYNDALLILRASIQLVTLDDTQRALADADGNGKLTYNDALLVLRTSIGLA